MFNSIQGIISAKSTDAVFVFLHGIELEILMPTNDMQELILNKESRVLTWLYHRDDQMRLFGFIDETRRNTFLELLKVDGIGPKGAMKIMSGISQDDLERALENADIARLEAVPGLGKKTAQKMVLSLKGKLIPTQNVTALSSAYNDLVEALVNMGYDRRTASEALIKAEASIDTGDISLADKEQLIFKEAIVYLSGS